VDELEGSLDIIEEGYGGKILGVSELLNVGDQIYCVESSKSKFTDLFCPSEKDSISSVAGSKESSDSKDIDSDEVGTKEDLMALLSGNGEQEETEEKEPLNVVIKACSQGALDAVLKSVDDINSDSKIINVVSSGVGDVTIGDVEYTRDSKGIIAGFSVGIDKGARDLARKEKVIIRTYKLIYELLDEMEDAAVSMQLPDEEEKVVGTGKVKKIFEMSDGSKVIGVRVESGEIKNGLKCRIVRDEDVILDSKIMSMRCGKEKVDKAGTDVECGLKLSSSGESREGDMVECYRIVKL
jgi:translation initiation factor IF-2